MDRPPHAARASSETPEGSDRPSVDAVHELRTPLTRIRGELELILSGGISDPLRGQLLQIHEDLDQLSRLCGALLHLARLEARAGVPGDLEGAIDLDILVSELVEQVTPLARERGISLRRGDTRGRAMRGNRALVFEALLNLLDAAISGATAGGAVSITIDVDEETVRMVVADAGRAEADASSELKLALAKSIARLHGGRFELDEAGGGVGLLRLVFPGRALR
jgi:signal transduction histidine kinase